MYSLAKMRLSKVVSSLEKIGKLPNHVEVSRIGKLTWATVFDTVPTATISESVSTGISANPSEAVLKAIVEWLERKAYQQGYESGHPACLTLRSDGFAAFPIDFSLLKQISINRARHNAYAEAVERFAWATWWDDHQTMYDITEHRIDSASFQGELRDFISATDDMTPVRKFYIVKPVIGNLKELALTIVIAEIKSGGVITGGACGFAGDENRILFRAMSELFRHSLASYRINLNLNAPETFYENRLAFFLKPEGSELFHKRIKHRKKIPILLPKLEIDSVVPHLFQNLVSVYRCRFLNQPAFMGGSIDRLCV
jgi:hypothetical protein